MTDSSVPPLPTRGTSPALTIVVVLMLLGSGALLWWKTTHDESTTRAKVPEAPAAPSVGNLVPPATPGFGAAPPPPPPPPPVEEPAPVGELPPASTGPEAKGAAAARRTSPCGEGCGGTAPPRLKAALAARAQQAKSCYQAALRQGASGEGRLMIAVRVAQGGTACSVSLVRDSLGNSGVASCVLGKFRSGTYPMPEGGCVDTQVPINFVSKP